MAATTPGVAVFTPASTTRLLLHGLGWCPAETWCFNRPHPGLPGRAGGRPGERSVARPRARPGSDAAPARRPSMARGGAVVHAVRSGGKLRVRKSEQVANRTAVAEDSRGRIVVATTEGAYTLWEFGRLLAKAPLSLSHAMSMDGGSGSRALRPHRRVPLRQLRALGGGGAWRGRGPASGRDRGQLALSGRAWLACQPCAYSRSSSWRCWACAYCSKRRRWLGAGGSPARAATTRRIGWLDGWKPLLVWDSALAGQIGKRYRDRLRRDLDANRIDKAVSHCARPRARVGHSGEALDPI